MSDAKRGIGNRTQSGSGRSWGSDAAAEPPVERTEIWRDEKTPPPAPLAPTALPATRRATDPSPGAARVTERITPPASAAAVDWRARLEPLLARLVAALRAAWSWLRRWGRRGQAVVRERWQKLAGPPGPRLDAESEAGDTFDRRRVADWQRFNRDQRDASKLPEAD